MRHEAVGEAVIAEILFVLIGIAVGCGGCVEQGEADSVVVGLVPAIFAIVHHCQSVFAVSAGEVGPALRIDFVGVGCVDGAVDGADAEVVVESKGPARAPS